MLAGMIEAAINVARFRSVRTRRTGSGDYSTQGRKCRVSSILGFPVFERMGVLSVIVVSQIKT
jgi:hypothetical protein